MKKFFKPLLLITLVVILAVIVIVPVKSSAASAVQLPGKWGSGHYGLTCWCPWIFHVECGCAIFQQ